MNGWNKLIFCMLTQIRKNQKLTKIFLGGHSQKWVWPAWSRDPEIGCLQHTGFLHVGTNSGKLKVDTMIFEWAWSKMEVVFQFTVPHPDVFWYRLNGMGAQKNSCNTFSTYISRKS